MKRYNNLYEKIISIENLNLADYVAREGKVNTYGVKTHDKHREENILKLHSILVNHNYKVSNYFLKTIYEPKERLIFRLPYYPDRIVHHAIMNILEPIWKNKFIHDTFSCIKGRGISKCRQRVLKFVSEYPSEKPLYCLKIDIRKFYPSIDHEILKSIVRRDIKCKETLEILDNIIDSAEGVPIGNYPSQYFANLYLTYFDHWIKEVKKIKHYLRYADDMVFLHEDKEVLKSLLPEIRIYLRDNLHLELKSNPQIFRVGDNKYDKSGRCINFVGFYFYRYQVLVRKCIKKRFCKKVAKINKKNLTQAQYNTELGGYLGWLKYSNSRNLIKKVIKPEYLNSIYRKLYGNKIQRPGNSG